MRLSKCLGFSVVVFFELAIGSAFAENGEVVQGVGSSHLISEEESNSDSKSSKVCSQDDLYVSLLRNASSDLVVTSAPGKTCFDFLSGRALFLWFPGCLPCVHEFSDVVFPAAFRFPRVRRMAATGLVVESVEESQAILNTARRVMMSLPGHEALPHLVIERGRGEVGRVLEELWFSRSEGLPGFLFCCEPGPVLVSIGDTVASELSFASGDYSETVGGLLDILATEGPKVEVP